MAGDRSDHAHWSRVAREWITWARAPDHDAFWAYRRRLAEFIGHGTGEALDIGCGEGRVSRVLRPLGYRVVACDPVTELVMAAREADSADAYAVAGGTRLPFGPEHFDLVVAYNVLMDVEDVPAVVRELRRVLRPAGTIAISIVHPFADRGRFAEEGRKPDFVLSGSYFGRQRFEGTDEHKGLSMRFAGWSQPLETYAEALEAAGLAITSLREPAPDITPQMRHLESWTRVPLFLWLKARALN